MFRMEMLGLGADGFHNGMVTGNHQKGTLRGTLVNEEVNLG